MLLPVGLRGLRKIAIGVLVDLQYAVVQYEQTGFDQPDGCDLQVFKDKPDFQSRSCVFSQSIWMEDLVCGKDHPGEG